MTDVGTPAGGVEELLARLDAVRGSLRDELGDVPPAVQARLDELGGALREFVARGSERQRRYRTLFDSAPDAYVVTDEAGVIVELNAAARELLGANEGPIVGTELSSYVAREDLDRFDDLCEQVRRGDPPARLDLKLAGTARDGEIPVGVSLADHRPELGLRWILQLQLEREATEVSLRAAAAAGEREASESRTASRHKTELLMALAHELRAPIAALIHQAELLTTGGAGPEVVERSQRILADNAAVLETLLADLLDVEQLGAGELPLRRKPVDVAALVREVCAARASGELRLVLPRAPVELDLDRHLLRRALDALVGEAEAACPSCTTVVELSTVDDGIELVIGSTAHPHEAPAPATAARTRSAGVGVALATAVVELHGGSVRIDDASGARRHHVRLPASPDRPVGLEPE